MLEKAKRWAHAVKRDVVALYIAGRDPRTPWFAKALAVAIAAYALSPIDLIPDFIPILGYLDDLLIVPLGILIVVRLIPKDLMAEYRETASARERRKSHHRQQGRWSVAALIVTVWLIVFAVIAWWAYHALTN